MTIHPDQQATLKANRLRLLHRTPPMRKCAVKITGVSGEFTTLPFTVNHGIGGKTKLEASEVKLTRIVQLLGGAQILATTPEGVATLDIVYEIRTGADV